MSKNNDYVGEKIKKKEAQMILLVLEILVFDWSGHSDFAAYVRYCCISLSVLMCHLQGLLVMVLVSATFHVVTEQ